jgi:hypothetical protein
VPSHIPGEEPVPAVAERRYGRFICRQAEWISEVGRSVRRGLVPTRIEYLWQAGGFEVTAAGMMFDPVPTGGMVPTYELRFEQAGETIEFRGFALVGT